MDGLTLVEEFLNTLDERTFTRHGQDHVAGEHLTSPAALAGWLAAHELPAGDADLAEADLRATLDLRAALRTALRTALGDGAGVPDLADHPLRLAPGPAGELRVEARSGRPWLDRIVETVAGSVARGEWKRIKLCAAPDCRWAFHDTSRNGGGRWCDMQICGNRHKTRAYRERRHRA